MTEIMKHFFTLMALLLTSVTFGQETCNNVFDYNDNNTIDIEDFLAILGLFADVDLDDDGTWDSLDNCLDLSACNYASELNEPCTYLPPGDCDCNGNVLDECGVCGGTGLAPGTCDCGGTLIDVIGVCGGDCWVDEDADGICDDVDECVGEYDACNVCNGPGAIYECGCANIPEGECDCDGNVLDAIGVCGGTCSADEDADGVCDDVDDCVGEFDVCGVCNGPGEVYECGCGDVPEGECDCEGNVLDALGECGGECLADEDGDGVCDDVDDCVGEFDECGVCNGDGAVYECGCNDIPEGECDCDGNVFDECGVCNGPGPTEIVIEDIVTYYDSVYLPFDDAWYVYPVDADTTFGFTCAEVFETCGNTKEYHGYDYQTILIGEQCWFSENLRSENYSNGDEIPSDLSHFEWTVTDEGAVKSTDPTYGTYYNQHTVQDSRGVCPSGWHSPSMTDWNVLVDLLGGPSIAGEALKSDSGWGSGDGTNSSGFSGLPGGAFDGSLFFWNYNTTVDYLGTWWGGISLSRNSSEVSLQSNSSVSAKTIRCLRNRGCTDSGACNYDSGTDTKTDNTQCVYAENSCEFCSGETDGTGTVVSNDADNDGVCDSDEVLGCTNPGACNYDELSTDDDGSCDLSCAPEYAGCGSPILYKGYEYSTVAIGEQCWFSENLRTEFYANGDSIVRIVENDENGVPQIVSGYTRVWVSNGGEPCQSPNIECTAEQLLAEYGRLYNWYAVDDTRGLCPRGWHVPTDEEWIDIEMHLGMSENEVNSTGYRGTDQGDKLKTNFGWANEGNGSNSMGFNGLPGGTMWLSWETTYGGSGAGTGGYWWTSSLEDSSAFKAWSRRLTSSNDKVGRYSNGGAGLLSVRCLLGEKGCTDQNACNYNSFQSIEPDNSLCIYPDGICEICSGESDGTGSVIENFDALGICGGACEADEDADGVCDVDEIFGCVYEWGCNYNPAATEDDGSCDPSCAPEGLGCGNISYQGYDYNVVKIGSQCWFAENLRSEQFENGDPISFNSNEGGDGLLYTWYAVDDERGLCPSGWSVPSGAEWGQLKSHLGGTNVAGDKMKSTYGWSNGGNGTNSSGFNALPSGYQGSSSNLVPGTFVEFWQRDRYDDCAWEGGGCLVAVHHLLYSNSDQFGQEWYSNLGSYKSIRCMKETGDEGSGCTDPAACNYDSNPSIVINNTFCVYAASACESCSGENDGTGTVVSNDFNGDGACESGCVDSWACNFNASAEIDDGSCEYESCAPPSCGNPKSHQGYNYETIQIGNQCWFAENLRSQQYANGEPILTNVTPLQWTSSDQNEQGLVTIYGGGSEECESYGSGNACDPIWSLDEYGCLYNWYAVKDERGLCPSGWHLPSNEEWDDLAEHLGGEQAAGYLMKSTSDWWYLDVGGTIVSSAGGSNESGFNGVPGGGKVRINQNHKYRYAETHGYWWTSTELNEDYGRTKSLTTLGYSLQGGSREKTNGYSVRCLED